MSEYNYFVQAKAPGAVLRAATMQFSPNEKPHLILLKRNVLEIYRITADELTLAMETIPIYADAIYIDSYRPPGHNIDYLLLLTEQFKLVLLKFDVNHRKFDVISFFQLKIGERKQMEGEVLVKVDPTYHIIAIHSYKIRVQIVIIDPQNPLQFKGETELGIYFYKIIDIDFLQNPYSFPYWNTDTFDVENFTSSSMMTSVNTQHFVLVVLSDLQRPNNIGTLEMICLTWPHYSAKLSSFQCSIPASSSKIIPLPSNMSGVLVLGDKTVHCIHGNKSYKDRMFKSSANLHEATCVVPLRDGGKTWIVGDRSGQLFLLGIISKTMTSSSLQTDKEEVLENAQIECLGEASEATCIVRIDQSHIFVGSKIGDSSYLRLNVHPNNGNYLTTIQTLPNTGPIRDFCVADIENNGIPQIVVCCGFGRSGSLRLMRSGIALEAIASLPVSIVRSIWSLRPSYESCNNHLLVISFLNETRALGFTSGSITDSEVASRADLVEASIIGFNMKEETIMCCNIENGNYLAQVTPSALNIASPDGSKLMTWKPETGDRILLADHLNNIILLGLFSRNIILLLVKSCGTIVECSQVQMNEDISCLSVYNDFCVVGLWNSCCIQLFSIPDLVKILEEVISADQFIIKSIVVAELASTLYLLVGTGDGCLISYTFLSNETNTIKSTNNLHGCRLVDKRLIKLGTQPLNLASLRRNELSRSRNYTKSNLHITHTTSTAIIALGNNPAVISSNTPGKLLVSNINAKQISCLCNFPCDALGFDGAIAWSDYESLHIGTIDEIEKMQTRTLPVDRCPEKVVYHEATGLIVYASSSEINYDDNIELPTVLCVFNPFTFENCAKYVLPTCNYIGFLKCLRFNDLDEDLIFVGATYVKPDDQLPKYGCIFAFRIAKAKDKVFLQCVGECDEMKGYPAILEMFCGKLLIAVNNQLCMWSIKKKQSKSDLHPTSDISLEFTFELEERQNVGTWIMSLHTSDETILVGDIMLSISLFQYDCVKKQFVKICGDPKSLWTMDMCYLTNNLYLATDNSKEFVVLQRNLIAASDEDEANMSRIGQFHHGQVINKLVKGCLNSRSLCSLDRQIDESRDYTPLAQYIWASVDGGIGLIMCLKGIKPFVRLAMIEKAVQKVINSFGGFDHNDWRDCRQNTNKLGNRGFIDGNIVEYFLDMPQEQQKQAYECFLKLWNVGDTQPITLQDLISEVETLLRMH